MKNRPKIRKVDSHKRKKARKDAQEALQQKTAAFLDHPKECCICKAAFERNKETVKTWHVVVNEKRVRLTCPSCWGKINDILENKND